MELRMNFNDFIKIKSIFKINDLSGEVLDYTIDNEEIKGVLGISGTYLLDDLKTNHTLSKEIPFNFVFANSDFIVNDVDCVNLEYELVDGRGLEVNFDIILNYDQNEQNNDLKDDERNEKFENVESLGEEQVDVKEDDSDAKKNEETDVISQSIEETDNLPERSEVQLEERLDIIPEKNEVDLEEKNSIVKLDDIEEIKDNITNEINKKLTSSLSYKEDNLPTEESFLNIIEERKAHIKVCYYTDDQDLEKVCRKNNVSINHVFKTNSSNNINATRRIIIDE